MVCSYIYIYIYIYVSLTYTNVQILDYKVVFFLFFHIPLPLDLPYTFISSHNSSESYTWMAKIVLLELLSHPEHTSKLLSCNLSCATIIHSYFLINAARGVVVSYLMWNRWLLYTSFFILLVFHAKSAFLHF